MDSGAWQSPVHRVAKVGHDSAANNEEAEIKEAEAGCEIGQALILQRGQTEDLKEFHAFLDVWKYPLNNVGYSLVYSSMIKQRVEDVRPEVFITEETGWLGQGVSDELKVQQMGSPWRREVSGQGVDKAQGRGTVSHSQKTRQDLEVSFRRDMVVLEGMEEAKIMSLRKVLWL